MHFCVSNLCLYQPESTRNMWLKQGFYKTWEAIPQISQHLLSFWKSVFSYFFRNINLIRQISPLRHVNKRNQILYLNKCFQKERKWVSDISPWGYLHSLNNNLFDWRTKTKNQKKKQFIRRPKTLRKNGSGETKKKKKHLRYG